MALSDLAIRSAKPREKLYKIFDDGGLFLLFLQQWGKYWRWKYRILGKEKLLSIGVYPHVAL